MRYTETPKIDPNLVTGSKSKMKYTVPELGGAKIGCTFMKRALESIGMTPQDWYDIHALGITDSKDRPKCPYCGKERVFVSISEGYKPTCRNKECISKEYTRVQKLSKSSNSERWEKQRETMGSSTKMLSECWKRDKDSFNGTYRQYASLFWEKWRKDNGKMLRDDFYRIRHERKLKRLEERWGKKTFNIPEEDIVPENLQCHGVGGIRTTMYSKYDNSRVSLHSLWERSYLILMTRIIEESSDIKEIRRNVKIVIPYIDPYGNHRIYIPDFEIEYMNGTIEIIEIKPFCFVDDEIIVAKTTAALEFVKNNPRFRYTILTEYDLVELGAMEVVNGYIKVKYLTFSQYDEENKGKDTE